MTWGTFLAEVRRDIKDEGATPKFADNLIYLYTTDAIRDYSQWFPKRVDRAELTLSGEGYPLPADFVRVVLVESPKERFLEERPARPGVKFPTTSTHLYFYIDGGSLYILGSPSEDGVFLTYYAIHGIPADETDTSFVFTVPDVDMELMRLYVKAKCFEQLRGRTASLDRFKIQSGARTDNPISPETEDLMGLYYRKIAERYRGKAHTLYRPGRAP